MDLLLIDELFEACLSAARLLDVDSSLQQVWETARSRLLPLKIGKHDQLQEWSEDFEDEDVNHRHVSHLFGIYPGSKLTRPENEALYRAARTSLDRRGDEGTGWSLAWKVGLWACFGDGNRAYRILSNLLRLVREDDSLN
nr:hypothetical protein [Paenibacillus frigoriresistens]